MELRRLGVAVAALTVAGALAFAGGATDSDQAAATDGGPQYGGTLHIASGAEPASPAIADAAFNALWYLQWIQEKPIAGNTWSYGPRGTGEYGFQAKAYQPATYWMGRILESWVISFDKLVWNVRPGNMWAADNVDFMENREVTAEDVAADVIRFLESPWKGRFDGLLSPEGVQVTGKHTLELHFENYSPLVFYYLGYEDRGSVSPPEVEAASADQWKNQVGTEAFMFKEYVTGSHMAFSKNPHYWDKAVIDGVQYDVPFVDEVIALIIPDPATRVAALTTGRLDWSTGIPTEQRGMVDRSAPELQSADISPSGATAGRLVFRSDEPPFDSTEVRRAMFIGTDLSEFQRLHAAEGAPLNWQPTWPGNPAYIPLDEMPADVQELFDYNPEKAKQMLADAGYPNGFKTAITVVSTTPWELDEAALLKDQWAKIGVEVEINAMELTQFTSHKYSQPNLTWDGILRDGAPSADPITYLGLFLLSVAGPQGGGGLNNYGMYGNSEVDSLISQISTELDPAEQLRMVKEASVIVQRDPPAIPLAWTSEGLYWWPWLKNYYGELSVGDDGSGLSAIMAHAWIDEALKKEMGK